MTDFYKLLNVAPLIPLEDLKKEMFKQKKLKSSHAASAPTPERRREAEDFLKKLDDARKVFENESTRKAYDESLIAYKKTQGPEPDSSSVSKKKPISKSSDLGNDELTDLLNNAKNALAAKRHESAIVDLKKILSIMPNAIEPRGLLIKTYCDMGTQNAIDSAVSELSVLERLLGSDRETFYSYSSKVYSKMGEILLNDNNKRAI